MIDILSYTSEQLNEYMLALGETTYRGDQLFCWLHLKQCNSFEMMSNIPKELRRTLTAAAYITNLSIEKKQVSRDGTIKYLFRLEDENLIETVVLSYRYGLAVCISSQVGCARGCNFCASAEAGLVRNLEASEMLQQVYRVEQDLHINISSVVLMGIGEPLDNFCNVMRFCDIICDEKGANLSSRAITISTAGVVSSIDKLVSIGKKYPLSVSLHAPTDRLRSSLMPINNQYNLSQLIASCKRYQQATKRRITFEYAVMAGINDSQEDAKALAKLLDGMKTHINLIPVNSARGDRYFTKPDTVSLFKEKLLRYSLNVTVRRTLGQDIDASCGQLRRGFSRGFEREI